MKKKISLILTTLMLLSGCGTVKLPEEVPADTTEAITDAAAPVTDTISAEDDPISVTSETTDGSDASEKNLDLVDENGLLTPDFTSRITEALNAVYGAGSDYRPYTALQDFNSDNLPEIVIIEHNGGQGNMPCKIYDPNTLECLGEFRGFCRDGYTRFLKTDEGVRVHTYYEHSVQLRYESYSLVTCDGGKYTETITKESTGTLNDCGAYNAGLIWDDPTETYIEDYSEAEEYCVSDFGYDIEPESSARFVTDLYNDYRRLENAYNEIEKEDSPVNFNFLAMGDYDSDGKPEAFYQVNTDNINFMNSDLEASEIFESDDALDGAVIAYKVWGSMIVFVQSGNHQPCAVFTVSDGKAAEVSEISRRGQSFDHSAMYNGYYELIQSAYDSPAHSWKPYVYELTEDGFRELGSIEVSKEDFLSVFGDEAQEIFDEIAAMDPDIENGERYEVINILYRGDETYIINYGWHIVRRYMVFKPGITEEDKLVDYNGEYTQGGVYLTALTPEIAVYPDEMLIPEWDPR